MICAKNYTTESKFINVMPRILWTFSDMMYNCPVKGSNTWENLNSSGLQFGVAH